MRMWAQSLASLSGLSESSGVGCRCGSDPALLGLWCRLAAASLIQPLAWEIPYAVGAALKKKKKRKRKNPRTSELKEVIDFKHQSRLEIHSLLEYHDVLRKPASKSSKQEHIPFLCL